jgi:hypothetical protein
MKSVTASEAGAVEFMRYFRCRRAGPVTRGIRIMFENELVAKIADFLTSIGLGVHAEPLVGATFLPGIAVRSGELYVDETRLLYPGDLLHEAGHLAVLSGAERASASDEIAHEDPEALEVGAIAWSYAAAVHLGIDASEVFHEGGYRGQAGALLGTFGMGVYPGVGTLARLGLTGSGMDTTGPRYPQMRRWVRE